MVGKLWSSPVPLSPGTVVRRSRSIAGDNAPHCQQLRGPGRVGDDLTVSEIVFQISTDPVAYGVFPERVKIPRVQFVHVALGCITIAHRLAESGGDAVGVSRSDDQPAVPGGVPFSDALRNVQVKRPVITVCLKLP